MSPSRDAPDHAAAPRFFDVRMRGFRDRAEVNDVLALLASRLQPLSAEVVDLHAASRRVLATDVTAGVEVPGFDRAAMDGYALRGQETFGAGPYNPLEFLVVGEAFPGRPFPGIVLPGQAVRIMTGAPLPEGADTVLQVEAAQEVASRLRVSEAVPPGRHVGRRGEDVQVGTMVLHHGRILRPQDLGVLASLGIGRVAVIRQPTVALIITGDELLPCGSAPHGYRIIDSNSVMLEALVRRDGGVPGPVLLVPDARAAVEEALRTAAADVVLVSGGSSVGQEDHAPQVLAALGELPFHGVALRPASPTGVGFLGGRPVFLLPGNPVSCLCAYDFFAGPAVRQLGGRAMAWPHRQRRLPLARKIASAVGRVDYVRVLITGEQVEPLATSGASILSSTTRADGFVLVPRDSEGYAAGTEVSVFLYDEGL
ncbi:MAG: molybdopterin molybdotransferase MoeA [Gemmataceae bacterium]|nr:molybdopterin molybdotransferase MoeA [Gemmataceae bacterium]